MKKLIIVCVLGCVVTASAFAQINVGAYTKSYWIPYRLTVFEDGEKAETTAVQVPWGEPDISAGINVDGWSEWGGLHLGLDVAYGAGNVAAHPFSAKGSGWVWVKPLNFIPAMDTLAIYLGNPNDSTLQGKIGGSNFATYVLNNSWSIVHVLGQSEERDFRLEKQNPEYNTFTRFNPYSWGNANKPTQNLWWPRIAAAALVTWEPVERLFIGFFVAPEMRDLVKWGDIGGVSWNETASIHGDQLSNDDINQDYYDVNKVYRNMQIGAGYTFQGIGFARAQFIGVRNVVEAAFQLTALGDLVLDIGFKVPFEGTNDEKGFEKDTYYKKKRDFQASLAATYRDYDFRFTGRVDAAFAGSDSSGREVKTRGLNLIAYLIPSYQFSVGTVGLDLGFEYEQSDDFNENNFKGEDAMQAGAGLWFQRNLGNATFKTGLVSRLPLSWHGTNLPFDFFLPIMLEVGF